MLSVAKQTEKLRNQTSVAKKIFNCVPMQEAWNSRKIMSEVKRQGSTYSLREVEGCLHWLNEDGLIKEVGSDCWMQVRTTRPSLPNKLTEPPTTTKKESDMPVIDKKPVKTVEPTATKSPLDILAGVAEQARALALSVETAALEISLYIEGAEERGKKLTQLQEILRSIS